MNPIDPMAMLRAAAGLLTLAALGGLAMAAIRFGGKRNPPAWLAMLHGLLAASGITLLAYAALTGDVPASALIAVLLLLLAAGGGAVLSLVYKWHQRLLPAWLVLVHALLAVVGYVLLLLAVFGDAALVAGI